MTEYLPDKLQTELPALTAYAEQLLDKICVDLREPDPIVLFDDLAATYELEDAIVSKRREATAPYYDAKNAIEAAFRPAAKAVERAKQLVDEWLRIWGRRSFEESGSVRVTHPDVVVRGVWGFEVVSEDDVPREFLTVDEEAIEEHVNRFGDSVPIPGVRVFRTIKVQRRPKK